MRKLVGVFPRHSEFEKARAALDQLHLPYEVISPDPGFAKVGVPALVVPDQTRMALADHGGHDFTCSGWVDHCPSGATVPASAPKAFDEDIFGQAFIMVLAHCMADPRKIRITAHLTGDLGEAFPYMNARMKEVSYNPRGGMLTFMDRHRLVVLYPRRVVLAKVDDIVDAWRVLEMARYLANETWASRARIVPSFEMHSRPPALEIFKRLPGTNCKTCGEPTCMAFAMKLWNGQAAPSKCRPVFEGDYGHLKPAVLEICAALGVSPPEPDAA